MFVELKIVGRIQSTLMVRPDAVAYVLEESDDSCRISFTGDATTFLIAGSAESVVAKLSAGRKTK